MIRVYSLLLINVMVITDAASIMRKEKDSLTGSKEAS